MEKNTDRLIKEASSGNEAAETFLRIYLHVAHRIDDCIDEPPNKESLIQTMILLLSLCSLNPFYLQHREQLFPLMALSLSRYATSVEWEKSKEESEQKMSDHLRSDGAMVIEYVALLCGGIARMRVISPMVWQDSWRTHHTPEGTPT